MNFTEFSRSKASSKPHFMLIGNPVAQSLSPLMHNTAAEVHGVDISYHAVQVQSHELSSLAAHFNRSAFKGANVTIPYKKMMLEYVDRLEPACCEIGAVNTLVKQGHALEGHNTDVFGFCAPLEPHEDELYGAQAIVFGTGGAARAVVHGLRSIGVEFIIMVSRNDAQFKAEEWPAGVRCCSYDAWPVYAADASIIVNTTPLGMSPNEAASPVSASQQDYLEDVLCYDIVYKPIETVFLQQANAAGAKTIGGLEMLIQQASKSFELWTGHPFPLAEVRKRVKAGI